ncbi:hypothetical protein BU15DRAFT_57765, partial [Melanogaster broomeanus]
LFGSSPVAPSIAVDFRVLELVKKLFVRMTPNTTAWCEALESFFDSQGYKLKSKNSLRRRFSQAYHWYSVLAISAEDYIFRFIHSVPLRDAQTSRLSPVDAGGHRPDSDQLSDPPTNTPTQGDRQVCAIDINPRQLNPNCIYCRTKPSDYLRSRCPLCFGAEIWGRKSHDNTLQVTPRHRLLAYILPTKNIG